MSPLQSLDLPQILSTEGMRHLDAASKEYFAKANKKAPSEQEVIQCGYTLMKEAGLALFKHVKDKALEPIAIFVGGGNNGGDGLVLAKLCIQAKIQVSVFCITSTDKFRNEAKLALDDFLKVGGSLFDFKKITEDPKQASLLLHDGFKLVVDCMLGNGSKGELRPEFANAVQQIKDSNLPIIAADAPTGYDSSAHACNEVCVHADETLLFGFPRMDAYVKEGGKAFGKTTVAKLSYPAEVVQQFDEKVYLVTEDAIPQLQPKRDEWGDKRVQGNPLIIAGSKDMPGAAALCTEAALRSGAGLVTLAAPQAITPIIQAKLSEPVFCSLADDENREGERRGDALCENRGTLQPQHISVLLQRAKHATAIAIGPGLSTNKGTIQAVLELLPQLNVPTVIDADALNAVATLNEDSPTCDGAAIDYLQKLQAPAILTPHVREFARLFGSLPDTSFEIPSRLRAIASSTNKVILLKGAPTYIASPDGSVYVIPTANSGMAKGGSGDVLTGIIVALLSQGLVATEAAVLGALLHQKAGRITREELGAFSMLPSDVIKNLHKAF